MEKVRIVYAGLRFDGNRTAAVWYKLVDDEPDDDHPLNFAVKGKRTALTGKGVWPGDVFGAETDGSVYKLLSHSRAGVHEDTDRRMRWRAEERADEARALAQKKSKAEGFGDMTLDELRAVYHSTIGSARRVAVLLTIHQHVTK